MIGSVQAPLVMNVGEDSQRAYDGSSKKPAIDIFPGQMLSGELKNLDISDVVTFAGELIQQDIPKIPDGLLKFEEPRLHICPFGVVLGTRTFPAGLSFTANSLLFEKRTNIECSMNIRIFERHKVDCRDSDRQSSKIS